MNKAACFYRYFPALLPLHTSISHPLPSLFIYHSFLSFHYIYVIFFPHTYTPLFIYIFFYLFPHLFTFRSCYLGTSLTTRDAQGTNQRPVLHARVYSWTNRQAADVVAAPPPASPSLPSHQMSAPRALWLYISALLFVYLLWLLLFVNFYCSIPCGSRVRLLVLFSLHVLVL